MTRYWWFSFPQVVIVGNGAVGKSSMIQKYCKGIFTTEYKKTIGVDFLEKRIWWDRQHPPLQIGWFFGDSGPTCIGVDASVSRQFLSLTKVIILMLSVNGEDVRLMLWDTAGQEEFDCITRAYYRYLSLQCCRLWTFIYWTYYWNRRDQKDERLKRPGKKWKCPSKDPEILQITL